MEEEDKYLMWLTRIDGIGIKRQQLLLNIFGSAKDIWFTKEYNFRLIKGLSDSIIDKIIFSKKMYSLEKSVEELEKKKIKFITKNNLLYPSLLKEIKDSPTGIYVLGKLPKESFIKISVIGSRKCSEYGLHMAYKLSKDMAKENFVVVSGMARGIDSMAHKGALDGNGKTIAVLGCGIDTCYPPENISLYKNIIENGCIISEYPPATQPMAAFFPMRNRIISGLSLTVIVVEASKKSGTIITVDQALEQGRDVYAVPGNATSKLSEGTNSLIKQGAPLILDVRDVIDALGLKETKKENIKGSNNDNIILAPEEKLVYDCISFEPITVDELILKLDTQVKTIQFVLTMLELKSYIQKLPGQRYMRSL